MEIGKFQPSPKPEPIKKKFGTVDYVREGTPLYQIWYKFTH